MTVHYSDSANVQVALASYSCQLQATIASSSPKMGLQNAWGAQQQRAEHMRVFASCYMAQVYTMQYMQHAVQ